jgi:DNA sulfur modification protein DndB
MPLDQKCIKMETKQLTIPALRGSIGSWIYYSAIIKFQDLERIDTSHKIKEDVSLDRWLQRKLSKRVEEIRKYLIHEEQRFFNTIIVGVYGENPDWIALDLSPIAEKFNIGNFESINESLGVLVLKGDEILFTIDGQHRVDAIKKALKDEKEKFQSDEISVIFVGHDNTEKGYVRTRKLFATINREAKKPSANDLAIIDETYCYNIVSRMLYANYKYFKGKISLTEKSNFDRSDQLHFTNLLTLVEVNKKLYKVGKYKDPKYTSPTYEQREYIFSLAKEFYDFVISNIVEYKDYFSSGAKLSKYRNYEKGKTINLLFMPVGLNLVATLYVHFLLADKLEFFKENINKLDFDLSSGDFRYIFYHPVQNTMITKKQTLGRNLAMYLLNENQDEFKLKHEMAIALNFKEGSPEYLSYRLPKKVSER